MRLVASLLAILVLATLLPTPTLAADECASARIATAPGCVDSNTVTLGQAPNRYYVYASWVQCPLNTVCQGNPPAHLVGIIWQETNGATGLQRAAGIRPADTVVLY